jgi:hypothetical protein
MPETFLILPTRKRRDPAVDNNEKWYQETWAIILFLLIFWPVGLYLMWRHARWSKTAKVVVTIILVFCVLLWVLAILVAVSLYVLDAASGNDRVGEAERPRVEETGLSPSEGKDEQDSSDPNSNLLFDRMKDVKLYFDDRSWTLGFQNKNGNNIIMEYVLEGESVYTRSEMVTVNFLGDMAGATPQQFAAMMEQSLREETDGDLEWNVFNEQNNELMYEFILKNDSWEADQHEVARVIAVEDGIFVLHYMIEEAPMSPEHRQKWIDLLLKAEVK